MTEKERNLLIFYTKPIKRILIYKLVNSIIQEKSRKHTSDVFLISINIDDRLSLGLFTRLTVFKRCVYEVCCVGGYGLIGCLIFTLIGLLKFLTTRGCPPVAISRLTTSLVTSLAALLLFEYLSGPFPPCKNKLDFDFQRKINKAKQKSSKLEGTIQLFGYSKFYFFQQNIFSIHYCFYLGQ